ncbi:MAG: ABC transporter ATP-binding protein [Pseudomonadota bacterium]
MALLEARGLNKAFGGLRATDNVDLSVEPGTIHALIGPNGAGKSTLVNQLSGRIAPDSGTVHLQGDDITHLPAHQRVQRGLAYTFQITSVFPNMTLAANVEIAALVHQPDDRAVEAAVFKALDTVGLLERRDQLAGDLAYGHQRLLEIALGIVQEPALLILDEPTQGLGDAEVAWFVDLLKQLRGDTTLLLIEHNMDVVMACADTITVLQFGAVIASGDPASIQSNDAVQAAYLGG